MPAAAAAAGVSAPTEATPLSSSSNRSTSSSRRRHHHDRPAPLSPTYHRWRRRLRAVLLLALYVTTHTCMKSEWMEDDSSRVDGSVD